MEAQRVLYSSHKSVSVDKSSFWRQITQWPINLANHWKSIEDIEKTYKNLYSTYEVSYTLTITYTYEFFSQM